MGGGQHGTDIVAQPHFVVYFTGGAVMYVNDIGECICILAGHLYPWSSGGDINDMFSPLWCIEKNQWSWLGIGSFTMIWGAYWTRWQLSWRKCQCRVFLLYTVCCGAAKLRQSLLCAVCHGAAKLGHQVFLLIKQQCATACAGSIVVYMPIKHRWILLTRIKWQWRHCGSTCGEMIVNVIKHRVTEGGWGQILLEWQCCSTSLQGVHHNVHK